MPPKEEVRAIINERKWDERKYRDKISEENIEELKPRVTELMENIGDTAIQGYVVEAQKAREPGSSKKRQEEYVLQTLIELLEIHNLKYASTEGSEKE